jgi:glutamate-ammonia-ligase adenylyltransferase
MLIKARVAAGEPDPGRALLASVEPLIYSTTLDFGAIESVSATRERIHEKLAARRGPVGHDVKLARGGIRDIEFLVQCLQRLHGGREAWVRHGGTLLALFRLRDKDFLSPIEYSRLASAYQFLRNLEHRLQFTEDRQTHTLPSQRDDRELMARRMPAAQLGSAPSAESLLKELNTHLDEVQEIYERVIHAQRPFYYTNPASAAADGARAEDAGPAFAERRAIWSVPGRRRQAGGTLARGNLRRGAPFDAHPGTRSTGEYLDGSIGLHRRRLHHRLFEHSYFAEQLIRAPDLSKSWPTCARTRSGSRTTRSWPSPNPPSCGAISAGACCASKARASAFGCRSSPRWSGLRTWPTPLPPPAIGWPSNRWPRLDCHPIAVTNRKTN